MKNAVNRALVAEKKCYNQPQTQMLAIDMMGTICAASINNVSGNTTIGYGGGATPGGSVEPD